MAALHSRSERLVRTRPTLAAPQTLMSFECSAAGRHTTAWFVFLHLPSALLAVASSSSTADVRVEPARALAIHPYD